MAEKRTGKKAGKDAGKKTTAGSTPEKSAAGRVENDVQRKMRELLEAKKAKQQKAQGEGNLSGGGVGPAANDKHQRQFRRKSG